MKHVERPNRIWCTIYHPKSEQNWSTSLVAVTCGKMNRNNKANDVCFGNAPNNTNYSCKSIPNTSANSGQPSEFKFQSNIAHNQYMTWHTPLLLEGPLAVCMHRWGQIPGCSL